MNQETSHEVGPAILSACHHMPMTLASIMATHVLPCSWVPPSSKSRSLGLAYSAGQVGNIVALGTSPLLINKFGWEAAFWVYGTLGLGWMLAWVPLVPDYPPKKAKSGQGGDFPVLKLTGLS